MITNERLKAIITRAQHTTPGPWVSMNYTLEPRGTHGVAWPEGETFVINPGVLVTDDDVEFIAQARQDIPDLIDEVTRLKIALNEAHAKIAVLEALNDRR